MLQVENHKLLNQVDYLVIMVDKNNHNNNNKDNKNRTSDNNSRETNLTSKSNTKTAKTEVNNLNFNNSFKTTNSKITSQDKEVSNNYMKVILVRQIELLSKFMHLQVENQRLVNKVDYLVDIRKNLTNRTTSNIIIRSRIITNSKLVMISKAKEKKTSKES